MKRYKRWLYSTVPGLHDAKTALERRVRLALKLPSEADFKAFRFFAERSDALVLDVGANIGQAIDAIRMAGWNAHVVALEPNPLCAQRLERTYSNDDRVSIMNAALAEAPNTMTLHVPRYGCYDFSSLASLDRTAAETWLNPQRMAFFDEQRQTIAEMRCDVRTLDSLGCDPFLVKMDVQGYEQQVLNGAVETIERCTPIFLAEMYHDGFDNDLLRGFGYAPYRFDGTTFRKGMIGRLNTFFFPPDKPPPA